MNKILIVALSFVVLNAFGQVPDPITYNSACNAGGVGRLVHSTEPVAKKPEEAVGLYVNADGYWAHCPLIATPNTVCGAVGVGRVPGEGLSRKEEEGWRVNANGDWEKCDQPCTPAVAGAQRVWKSDTAVCVSQVPAADRTIQHGRVALWAQIHGANRGKLLERCDNGSRTTEILECAPATQCETPVSAKRNGVTYTDPRRPFKAVPNGESILLQAADGRTWPASCVKGAWSVPSVLPRPPVTPPSRPEPVVGCRPGVWTAVVNGRVRQFAYQGPVVGPNQLVVAEGLQGAANETFMCDGKKFVLPPAPAKPAASSAESAADEWKRLFDLQNKK